MLVGNGSTAFQIRARLLGATAAAGFRSAFGMIDSPLARFVGGFNRTAAYPVGYSQGAILPALSSGGMACRILTAAATVTANIGASANMQASPAGVGSISAANLAAGRNMSCTIAGVGAFSCTLAAPARMTCTISIGASPSAFDIAQAVWQQSLTAFNDVGSAGKEVKDKLTLAQFLGLK